MSLESYASVGMAECDGFVGLAKVKKISGK